MDVLPFANKFYDFNWFKAATNVYIHIYIYIAYKHCDFTHTKSQKLGSNLDPVNFQKYVLVNLSES